MWMAMTRKPARAPERSSDLWRKALAAITKESAAATAGRMKDITIVVGGGGGAVGQAEGRNRNARYPTMWLSTGSAVIKHDAQDGDGKPSRLKLQN